jgi:hypothetical protein
MTTRSGLETDRPEELVADPGGVQGVLGLPRRCAGVVTLDDVSFTPASLECRKILAKSISP